MLCQAKLTESFIKTIKRNKCKCMAAFVVKGEALCRRHVAFLLLEEAIKTGKIKAYKEPR